MSTNLIALGILTSFIESGSELSDVDRTVAMSAYMAKKLEADMARTLEDLEAEVWPEATQDTDTDNVTSESSAHDTDI